MYMPDSLVRLGLQLSQHTLVNKSPFDTIFIEPAQHPVGMKKAIVSVRHQICMLVAANVHAAASK
jgi:hypothetical protein